MDRHPQLIQRIIEGGGASAEVLLMDFNCLIYQCLRSKDIPPYDPTDSDRWEAALLRSIQNYVTRLWNLAGKPGTVVLCVDGVVPMAKIRQQRMRRFKSIWLAQKETEAGVRKGVSWDTNAITPGTAFMEKLEASLQALASRHAGWTVSGASEPGEGEQKLMEWCRAHVDRIQGKRVWIYGLDADLILLSLLHMARWSKEGVRFSLYREAVEMGKVKIDSLGKEEFCTFDLGQLLPILLRDLGAKPGGEHEALLQYVAAMSFLGNDFLPHSLGVKIRTGGHDRVLEQLRAGGPPLVVQEDGRWKISREGLIAFLHPWAHREQEDLEAGIHHKYTMRSAPPKTDDERAMLSVQNAPLEWKAESVLWSSEAGCVNDWRGTYYREWLKVSDAGVDAACTEYLKGTQWILDYYTGQKAVSPLWYFPWNVPPLWSDLVHAASDYTVLPEASVCDTMQIQPQEQLALVLPSASWGLIREPKLRAVPAKLPAYWPSSFGFFSAGRRWMWECETEIPILTVLRLRSALRLLR